MIVLDYNKKNHKGFIHACVIALKSGKIIAYPTDTSYGLAVDASNVKAIKKLYKVKERQSTKPVHIIPPSISFAKKIADWNSQAEKLIKKFWPGPLTLVQRLKDKGLGLRMLSAKTGTIGIRMPKNNIALDLAKKLKRPITTTSANPSVHLSDGYDSFSAEDVLQQFKNKKYKPDIIINAGKLPKRKPSTFVKLDKDQVVVLRHGPISEKEIMKVLRAKG